jgi:hypothetical protein
LRYPGHDRIDSFRSRLTALRRDADDALDRTAALENDVDALRTEIARLTVTIGTQIAALQEAVERIERRAAESGGETG